jgi:hypothetical protein
MRQACPEEPLAVARSTDGQPRFPSKSHAGPVFIASRMRRAAEAPSRGRHGAPGKNPHGPGTMRVAESAHTEPRQRPHRRHR